ncbi:MAG: hypothetical protein JW957_09290 [Candidatus Omnitrophica bacterium]|nr:hypothetical protein [Candidatus Omnitrophota bacterium]
MEKKNILELLEKVSADCGKAVEKGFSSGLNLVTIKKQIDECIKLLGAADEKNIETKPDGQTGQSAVKKTEPEKAEEKTSEPEAVNANGNLTGRVEELSGEVVVKDKAKESQGKLGSVEQGPAQELKRTSSVPDKPAGSDNP